MLREHEDISTHSNTDLGTKLLCLKMIGSNVPITEVTNMIKMDPIRKPK